MGSRNTTGVCKAVIMMSKICDTRGEGVRLWFQPSMKKQRKLLDPQLGNLINSSERTYARIDQPRQL
ncbi:hypothetical protein V6N13_032262 [Hibiscus sabdariffa]|uniref:Uncharacterized protein n=2 Tax=Hibiscus sabdariffa TaxID=183260 RepID=A0ABR2AIF1_9ROSI